MPRDGCKLMVLNREKSKIDDRHFFDLTKLLRAGDVLVLNNSRVLPARLFFEFEGKKVELFLVRAIKGTEWLALGKPGKILQPGITFTIAPDFTFEVVEVLANDSGGQRRVRFNVAEEKLQSLIEKYGHTPLPPYIKNSHSTPEDYQTVYAKTSGSIAAATAGLHFTERLLADLKKLGVRIVFVTLHVGLGTFLPIKTDEVEKHQMHSEIFELTVEAANELKKARKEERKIIAAGTTSVRVLESCFDKVRGFEARIGETAIFIYPGYEWKCVDGLITNFHLPQSTLLLLTCSFGGTDFVMEAYRRAVLERYRFYSFGDAMLIL